MKPLRVGFMGTPDFALEALNAIHESTHEVVVVYSQPPRPKGRGHKVQPSPVHAYAEAQNIKVLTPLNFKTENTRAAFAAHNLDVAIVAAYGLILPTEILEAPTHGCINIHGSLLPRWRGASPIQQAIWHGDSETGIAIMQMDKGLDTGPIISIESVAISLEATASSLHEELATLGGCMIVEALDRLAQEGALPSTPQDSTLKTYAPLLKKEDGRVNWNQSAAEIHRQIRALNPWPGVLSEVEGKRIKILSATLTQDENAQASDTELNIETEVAPDTIPGTILNRHGDIACGAHTILRLTKIQPHGSKAMDFASAINGGHVTVGQSFARQSLS